MRSAEEFDAAQRLIAAGINDCAIARQTWYTATDGAGLATQTAGSAKARQRHRPAA